MHAQVFLYSFPRKISQQDESDLSRRAVILPMLTLAVIEVQNIVSMGSIEDKQWNAPECRSVSNLPASYFFATS